MSTPAQPASSQSSSHWASLISSSATAVVVGFASTILVVMEGARAVGASPAQQASWTASLCFGMAITSFILAYGSKMPIVTAWSTPGSVLIASSAVGIGYTQALGAFVVAGVLMLITGLVRPLERAIEDMPASVAAAMLAGVLLKYVLGIPAAALAAPYLVLPLILAFFAMRLMKPLYAVPVVVVLGLLLAMVSGRMEQDVSIGLTALTFDWPVFDVQAVISLGVPLYLVTMASQNLPGFAVLRANGYQPPVGSSLLVTGTASALLAPFGAHAVNLAAITASLVAGPDAHPDPTQRWKMIYPYTVMYILVGLAAATFVGVLGALPKELVAAIAGLALFGPFLGGATAMVKDQQDIDAAAVTFLVTASGITLFSVGAAFWGLVAGLLLWAIKRLVAAR